MPFYYQAKPCQSLPVISNAIQGEFNRFYSKSIMSVNKLLAKYPQPVIWDPKV